MEMKDNQGRKNMKCKKCGEQNSRGAKFCENCGKPLHRASNKKKFLGIFGGGLVIVGCIVGIFVWLNQPLNVKSKIVVENENIKESVTEIPYQKQGEKEEKIQMGVGGNVGYQYEGKLIYLNNNYAENAKVVQIDKENGIQTIISEGGDYGKYIVGVEEKIYFSMNNEIVQMDLNTEEIVSLYKIKVQPEEYIDLTICGVVGEHVYFSYIKKTEGLCAADLFSYHLGNGEVRQITDNADYASHGNYFICDLNTCIFEDDSMEENTYISIVDLETGKTERCGAVSWCYENGYLYTGVSDDTGHITNDIRIMDMKTKKIKMKKNMGKILDVCEEWLLYVDRTENNGVVYRYNMTDGSKIELDVDITVISEGFWTYGRGNHTVYYAGWQADGGYCIDNRDGSVYYLSDTEMIRPYLEDGKLIYYNGFCEEVRDFAEKEERVNGKVVYQEILEEYKNAVEQDSDYRWEHKEEFSDVNETAVGYYRSFGDVNLYYAYLDIDQNGGDEMLVATGEEDWHAVAEIYATDGEKAYRLIKEDSLGDRSQLTIYTNGVMKVKRSGGVGAEMTTFYQMAANGYEIEIIGEEVITEDQKIDFENLEWNLFL